MTRQWVNGPGFVEWLWRVRPQLDGHLTTLLPEKDWREIMRAREGKVVGLSAADRICCHLFLHIDSEMPEELWVEGPRRGRPPHPRAEEAANLLGQGKTIREVAKTTGMSRSSLASIRAKHKAFEGLSYRDQQETWVRA